MSGRFGVKESCKVVHLYEFLFPDIPLCRRNSAGERAGNVNLECRDADPIHCHDGVPDDRTARYRGGRDDSRSVHTTHGYDPFGLESRMNRHDYST